MKHNTKTVIGVSTMLAIIALLCGAGCKTLYQGTITMTKVVDVTMQNWAQASVAGLTTAEIDAKVVAAHSTYRQACGEAQAALMLYKETGDPNNYIRALETARFAANSIITLITPWLTETKADTLREQLKEARGI